MGIENLWGGLSQHVIGKVVNVSTTGVAETTRAISAEKLWPEYTTAISGADGSSDNAALHVGYG